MKDIEDNITNTPRIGALADFFEKTALGELGKPDNTYLGDINLKYAVINWNSGNFYTVYASNSKNNLLSFLSNTTPALTPSQFVHTKLPVPLLNLNEDDIKYRVVKEK